MEGHGTYIWPNGEIFEGEYVNDVTEGQGIHTWPDGSFYKGEFKNDIMEGHGTLYYTNGNSYTGEFQREKIEGQGLLTYSTGCYDRGEFVNGRLHGKGVKFDEKKRWIQRGVFEDGKLKKGMWRDLTIHGQVVLHDETGKVLEVFDHKLARCQDLIQQFTTMLTNLQNRVETLEHQGLT